MAVWGWTAVAIYGLLYIIAQDARGYRNQPDVSSPHRTISHHSVATGKTAMNSQVLWANNHVCRTFTGRGEMVGGLPCLSGHRTFRRTPLRRRARMGQPAIQVLPNGNAQLEVAPLRIGLSDHHNRPDVPMSWRQKLSVFPHRTIPPDRSWAGST